VTQKKSKKTKKQFKPDIEKAVNYILDGLTIDGGHHKQWYLEQALCELKGKDWVEANNKFDEDGETYDAWEEGIPG